jgi:putative tryptophan/tyrosine transport system substrate-binding protein
MIRRREFITLLGGAAASWPLASRAQQAVMPVIGWLSVASADGMVERVADFRAGLKEQGFVEHQNVLIEYRWANEQSELLPRLAAELITRRVSVIAVGGGTVTALAAKASTAAIPIVFAIAADPVRAGLVESLSRPGGNITGIVGFADQLITKRLEVVGQLLPNASVIGALLNPSNPNSQRRATDLRGAAAVIGREISIVQASHSDELESAFRTAIEQRIGALIIQNDIVFVSERDRIVSLASRYHMPTIYETREHVVAGGLLSYGANISERFRLLGQYTGKILQGHKPADLPVMQPTKFDLVINLRTAKALGLEVPPPLLARADEVIE